MVKGPPHPRRRRPSLRAAVACLALGAVLWLVRRGRRGARRVPISPVTAGRFVGPAFVERAGLDSGEPVSGELDDLAVLESDAFDPAKLDPAVRRFYEDTGAFRLRYRTTWHHPFRIGAWLATRLTRRIQQLNLPGPGDSSWHDMESRFLGVAEPPVEESAGKVPDGTDRPAREDVRAWVRTDPESGAAVFVGLYATHRRDGDRLVNIAAPLPGGNVSTVLRPELLDEDADQPTGLRLTTRGEGDTGLYLRTPLGPVELPAGQEFRVWRLPESDGVRSSDDGETPAGDPPTLGAVHEMWLLGRRFLTVDYELVPVADAASDETGDDDAVRERSAGDGQTRTSAS